MLFLFTLRFQDLVHFPASTDTKYTIIEEYVTEPKELLSSNLHFLEDQSLKDIKIGAEWN